MNFLERRPQKTSDSFIFVNIRKLEKGKKSKKVSDTFLEIKSDGQSRRLRKLRYQNIGAINKDTQVN